MGNKSKINVLDTVVKIIQEGDHFHCFVVTPGKEIWPVLGTGKSINAALQNLALQLYDRLEKEKPMKSKSKMATKADVKKAKSDIMKADKKQDAKMMKGKKGMAKGKKGC